MWNSLELQCPADDLVAYPHQDHYIMENLRDFVTVLTTSADTLTSESPLWNEMKVLNNIQQKYKRILRCDRFLIFLHRVGHCLRKMVLLNLSKSYLDLAERFLAGFQGLSGTPLLPSRQQVEYILIRTLSAARLVCEAITYSRESFCYLIQKIKVGHLILDLIMATSIIARLNILLRATLEQLCSMYKQVLFWRYKVKKGKFDWGQKFNFPQDVEEWIKGSEPTYLKPLSMSKEDIERVKAMLNQTNGVNCNMDVSDSESVVLVDEVKKSSVYPDIIMETDCGEVIPRPNAHANHKSVQKKNVKTSEKCVKKKADESNQKIMTEKAVETNHSLTKCQKSLLQKIVNVQSLYALEDLWGMIKSLSKNSGHFPKALTEKRKGTIDKFFAQVKANYQDKKFFKTYKTKPKFLKTAILRFSEKIGFAEEHINFSEEAPSEEVKVLDITIPLRPVKSVKELKLLYKQLREILEFNKEWEKLQLLTTIFKHRMIDIKHLKGKGERILARKLTSCTSKEFLALYQ